MKSYLARGSHKRLGFLVGFYRANLVASSLYGLTSFAVCSAYTLAQPHYTGHLFPAASAVVALFWGMHCGLLGVAIYDAKVRHALIWPWLPVSIAILSAIACAVRYWVQA